MRDLERRVTSGSASADECARFWEMRRRLGLPQVIEVGRGRWATPAGTVAFLLHGAANANGVAFDGLSFDPSSNTLRLLGTPNTGAGSETVVKLDIFIE